MRARTCPSTIRECKHLHRRNTPPTPSYLRAILQPGQDGNPPNSIQCTALATDRETSRGSGNLSCGAHRSAICTVVSHARHVTCTQLEKNLNRAPAPCPLGSWAPTVWEQGLQDAKHHQHVSRHARSSNQGALPDTSKQRYCNLQRAPVRLALNGG